MTEADLATERADRFVAGLGELRLDRSRRNVGLARLGAGLQIVGAGMAVAGLGLSQATDNALNQSTDISLGLAGIALCLVGSVLFLRYSLAQFLRFWLLRLSFEQQHRPPAAPPSSAAAVARDETKDLCA
jgi:hypothetical protein